MSDIRQWLEELSLGQYAEAFEENAVDLEVLPKLTEQHLEGLGLPLGHRLKILDEAGKLDRQPAGWGDT